MDMVVSENGGKGFGVVLSLYSIDFEMLVRFSLDVLFVLFVGGDFMFVLLVVE